MDRGKFSILVVDDEEGMREGIQKTLQLEGFSVETAANGTEALEKLQRGGVHLAFIDLKLPDFDGVEIVRRMQPSATTAVIMTAYATVETAVSAMKMGVADYIKKPFDNRDIICIAERFLRTMEMRLAQDVAPSRVPGQAAAKPPDIILRSSRILEAVEKVEHAKDSSIPILLLGDSGTGKEVFARLIHARGDRRDKPFIAINCSAIPRELLETELFGHERGAFSGAVALKKGKFEIAGDGILFLDEIGDMEYGVQSKLLRVLEERSFERIGGTRPIAFTARVVASTNRNLRQLIKEQRFRSDLYYRLNGLQLELPPLRERLEDLKGLVQHFLSHFCGIYGKQGISLSSEAMRQLQMHEWPGNIRELKNVIESAVLLAEHGAVLLPESFRIESMGEETSSLIRDLEQDAVLQALESNRFNRTLAARALQISRKTLYNRMKKFNL
jgi:DNA-binding NtrC family response regulator